MVGGAGKGPPISTSPSTTGMRVLIDALGGPGHPRGIGRYVRELASSIAGLGGPHLLVALGPWHRDFYAPLEARGVELIEVNASSVSRLARHAWHVVRLPRLARDLQANLIHVPDRVPTVPVSGRPLVVTVHDVAEYDLPQAYGQVQRHYRRLILRRQLRHARHVITPSRFLAHRLALLESSIGERTSVVVYGPGIDPAVRAAKPDAPIPRDFFLYVGAIQRHKNVPRVVRAFRSLAGGSIGLVLAGADHNDSAALERAIDSDPRIRRLRRPSDEELAWLYSQAAGLVFPSLYEGFGFPALEAMSFGCPVVTSDRGALRELADGAALLVNPLDEAAVRVAMQRLIEDANLRDTLASLGRERASLFSWDRAAAATIAVYRAALDS